jgi:gliding motility-associated-like protein
MQFITSTLNVGMNYVDITATDNGSPSSSASLTFWLFVDTTGISNFNPSISGDTVICVGDTTSLHVNTGWSTYLWNTGATTSSIYGLDTAGIYSATVSFNQCYKTIFQEVYEMPAPHPVISGVLNSCNGLITALSTSSNYALYSWDNNGNIISITSTANAVNGTIILTVVDSFGCQGDTSAIITLNSSTVSISGISAICQGNSIVLTATASGPGTFQCSNNATTPTTTVTSTGNYIVTYTDGGGCAVSDTFYVTFWPLPNAAFINSPDSAFNLTTNVQFTDQSTIASPGNIISWVWVFSDTTTYLTQNPSHVFGSYGQFNITLYVTSANGCMDSVTHEFWVVPPITFPNVFSPGSSPGSNDFLVFPNLFFYGPAQLQVFNRWGSLLYESSDYKNNWDGMSKGKLISDGTYYYIIKLKNGKTRKMPLTVFIKE